MPITAGRRRLTAAEKAKKIATVPQVKRLINAQAEHKFLDTLVNQSVDSAGVIWQLSAVPQGDTASSRDGAFLMPKSLQWKGGITVGDTTNFMRVIVFRDMDGNGTAPIPTNVLETVSYHGLKNNTNKKRFTFLWDRLYSLSTLGQDGSIRPIQGSLRLAQKKIGFAATSTAPRTNHLYVLFVSDSGAITHPSALMTFRLNFTDS